MKKLFITLSLIVTLLCSTFLFSCNDNSTNLDQDVEGSLGNNACAIFTLDVNPGVRFYVDADDKIIEVEPTNDDGEEIVDSIVDCEGEVFEEVIEIVIAELEEQGYLEGEESSVLISIEKKEKDISEKLNQKINESFEKRGKKGCIIEQELDNLEKDFSERIDELSEKYHISKGKAHLIDKIREEFPELSEEDLAQLNVNDLGIILDETSDDVKKGFKKIDKPVENEYLGKENAVEIALASLSVTGDQVEDLRVRATRGEGKMIYEVKFIYEEQEYMIFIDSKTGEILESVIREHEKINPEEIVKDFCDKHDFDKDGFKGDPEQEFLTKGEVLEIVLQELEIDETLLKRTDVKLHETLETALFEVRIESVEGDFYKVIVDAFSGTVIKVEENSVTTEVPVENEVE